MQLNTRISEYRVYSILSELPSVAPQEILYKEVDRMKISQLLFSKTLFQRTNRENANTIFWISKTPPKKFFGRLRRTTKKEVYRCPERPKGAPYHQIVAKILPENLSTSHFKDPFSKNKSRECKHDFPDIKPPPLKKIFLCAFGAQLRRRCIGVRSDRRELPITKSLQRFFQKISQLPILKTLFQRTNRENVIDRYTNILLISGYRVCIKFDRSSLQEILYKEKRSS
jgi:hypothetical protein